MATGLSALMLGLDSKAMHLWYLAVRRDAVEGVELTNVLGVGHYAGGGLMTSKPPIARGKYIQRMSPAHCKGCRFDPAESGDCGARGGVAERTSRATREPALARRAAFCAVLR